MSNLLSLPTESSLYKRQYSVFLRSPKYKIPSAHKKQEIWRQKQIYIYYSSGRPLYGNFTSYYNPSIFRF